MHRTEWLVLTRRTRAYIIACLSNTNIPCTPYRCLKTGTPFNTRDRTTDVRQQRRTGVQPPAQETRRQAAKGTLPGARQCTAYRYCREGRRVSIPGCCHRSNQTTIGLLARWVMFIADVLAWLGSSRTVRRAKVRSVFCSLTASG